MAEIEKIPGYWRDIEKSRAEARRLLAEPSDADFAHARGTHPSWHDLWKC